MDSQVLRTYAAQPTFIGGAIDPFTTGLSIGLNACYFEAPTTRTRQVDWASVDAGAFPAELLAGSPDITTAIPQPVAVILNPSLYDPNFCSFEPDISIIDHSGYETSPSTNSFAASETTEGMARNFSCHSLDSVLGPVGFSHSPSRDSTPGLLPCPRSGTSSTQMSPNLVPALGPASKITPNGSSELPSIGPCLFPFKGSSQPPRSQTQQSQPSTYQPQASRNTIQLHGRPSQRGNSTVARGAKAKSKLSEIYPCQFAFAGCRSTFPSRNEWKRHMATFHIMERYYKCTEEHRPGRGPCNEVFNRPDLLMQHVRRILKEDDGDEQSVPRAEVERRRDQSLVTRLQGPPPPLRCPSPQCNTIFPETKNSWDARAEHISKHHERKDTSIVDFIGHMAHDYDFVVWALSIGAVQITEYGEYTCEAPVETTHQIARKFKKTPKKAPKSKKQVLRSK
ncbi:hypothetical protein Cpir12675_005010 [Ceratocystis pirilliformis]|uniref:C2H2-type domain-containing protein n=1 Tax=Ceratocystis pirilliformis TaxID=259994 RepID=A0ABR3YTV9_9PEZI